jgi:putative SOS response-associated peptidase YedK
VCGRFIQISIGEIIGEEFQLPKEPKLTPRYNIAPSQSVAAIRLATDSNLRELCMLQWGLIPFWAKDTKIGYRTINARSETVADKPAFRAAFKHRRCLIPADGFYEWKRHKGRKQNQPYFIRLKEARIFAFAGLWEHWKSPEGEIVESCTILTTQSNELIGELHDRMPVILDRKQYDLWLGTSVTGLDTLKPLFNPFPKESMEYYPVSLHMNKPTNDHPQCIEPV